MSADLRCDRCGRRPREEWRIIVERARCARLRRWFRILQHEPCRQHVAVMLSERV